MGRVAVRGRGPLVTSILTSLVILAALLDCIPGDGCKGGKVWTALEYMKNTGLPSSDAYPYKAKKGRCRKNVQPYAKIREWGVVTPDPESHESWLPTSPIATNMLAPVEFQVRIRRLVDRRV